MSRMGKIYLGLAVLFMVVGTAARLLVPDFQEKWWAPLTALAVFVALAVFQDRKFYKEFFSLKTTKHGLNMGSLIVLAVLLLAGINFIAFKNNKKWDWTDEKLNSLSEHSVKILKSLDAELTVKGFYTENSPDDERDRAKFNHITKMYTDETKKVLTSMVNPIKRPDEKRKYNVEANGTVVLEYKGKRSTVTDLSEETLTNAIVKLTRDKNKKLYFFTGHGEVDLNSQEVTGGGRLKKYLEDASYEVKPLNFIETKAIPADADVVVVFGPTQPLLQPEMDAIMDFAKKGGKLWLSADPGKRHNVAALMKEFGVQFQDNYIVDQVGQMVGVGAAMAIGMQYSSTSDITKSFKSDMMTGFLLSSSLKKIEGAPATFKYDEIVKSSPASFSKKELGEKVKFEEGKDERGPLPLAIAVNGTFTANDANKDASTTAVASAGKEFSVILVGDSDFATNQLLDFQLNKDLALNTISYLSKDSELISIRPKEPAGTKLTMTNNQAVGIVLGLYAPIPLMFFLMGGFLWYRRRNA